jgi:hypothetical protein
MNLIKKSVMDVWKAVREHKLIFISVMILQLLIILVIVYLGTTYPQKLYADVEGITIPVQNANYNATSIQAGMPFSTDMATAYKSYKLLIGHLKELMWISLGIFLILEALIWVMIEQMFVSDKKVEYKLLSMLKAWSKYLISAGITIVLPLVIAYFVIKTMLYTGYEEQAISGIKWIGIILCVFGYIFLNTIAHLNSSWKLWIKKSVKTLILKAHYTLMIFLINLIVMAVMLGGIALSMNFESSFFLVVPLSGLFILVLVKVRLFWIASLHNIGEENHENHHR